MANNIQELLNALKPTEEEEQLFSPMNPTQEQLASIKERQQVPELETQAPVQAVMKQSSPKKDQSSTNSKKDTSSNQDTDSTSPETPLSAKEKLMQEYLQLSGKDNEELKEARERDRMLKIGGSIGDALATYLNAQSQMRAKVPGVQVQQGAGLGKVADMFATAPEIASDLKDKREALMNQYKQLAMEEMSKNKREAAAKIAEDKNKILEERNRLFGQQVAKMGSGREEARQFRENKFEYDKIVKLQDSFNKDKQVVKAEERIQSAATLRDMVDGNPITQEAAKTFAARASGEVGALSDQDRAAYGGSKAIIDRINSTLTRAATGELTDTDKKFMKELADKFEQAGKRDLQERLSIYSKQGTKRTNMSEDEVKETIRPDLALEQNQKQMLIDNKIENFMKKNNITNKDEAIKILKENGKL